jgi:hypothetical protein
MLEIPLRVIAFVFGIVLVRTALLSAIKTFVMPRAGRDWITTTIFKVMRNIFNIRAERSTTFEQRDEVMAMYAPICLLVLPGAYLMLMILGFALAFLGIGVDTFDHAVKLSGSSILTLGYESVTGWAQVVLSLLEAGIGLVMVALVISYLPTMYGAFSKREAMVTLLEMRVDSPPWGPRILVNYFKYVSFEALVSEWRTWELWFAELDEGHSSLAALAYFRSPQSGRSWVTAAGAVLDSCALQIAALDTPRHSEPYLCLTAGIDALAHIAHALDVPFRAPVYDPKTSQPVMDSDWTISISRAEFDAALELLEAQNIPLQADREKSWITYQTWRAMYDENLLRLAARIMVPYAPWTSDRSLPKFRKLKLKQLQLASKAS